MFPSSFETDMIERIGGLICVRLKATGSGNSTGRGSNPWRREFPQSSSLSLSIDDEDPEVRSDNSENIDDAWEDMERAKALVGVLRPEKGLQARIGGVSGLSIVVGDKGSDDMGGNGAHKCIPCSACAVVTTPPPGAVKGYLGDFDAAPRFLEEGTVDAGDIRWEPTTSPSLCG